MHAYHIYYFSCRDSAVNNLGPQLSYKTSSGFALVMNSKEMEVHGNDLVNTWQEVGFEARGFTMPHTPDNIIELVLKGKYYILD